MMHYRHGESHIRIISDVVNQGVNAPCKNGCCADFRMFVIRMKNIKCN